MSCMTAFTIGCVFAVGFFFYLMHCWGGALIDARKEGRYAGQSGVDAGCCPYDSKFCREEWMCGHVEGMADRKNGLAPLKKDN